MTGVKNNVRYQTDYFVQNLIKFADEEPNLDVIVATLPAYHHLKKAIFEVRKSELFGKRFELKFVLTKVSANNFFANENRNLYQFLIENCMKGVSQAVVFERKDASQANFQIMFKHLHNASYDDSVLPVPSSKIDLEALAQILLKQNDKLNMFYTKHFYGFEKEGKCDYYQEKAVTGHFFNYKYLIKQELIDSTLVHSLNQPINEKDIKKLLPKTI